MRGFFCLLSLSKTGFKRGEQPCDAWKVAQASIKGVHGAVPIRFHKDLGFVASSFTKGRAAVQRRVSSHSALDLFAPLCCQKSFVDSVVNIHRLRRRRKKPEAAVGRSWHTPLRLPPGLQGHVGFRSSSGNCRFRAWTQLWYTKIYICIYIYTYIFALHEPETFRVLLA